MDVAFRDLKPENMLICSKFFSTTSLLCLNAKPRADAGHVNEDREVCVSKLALPFHEAVKECDSHGK